MKIIIPSKGRPLSISTHKLFEGQDYKIVVHNEQEASMYADNPSIPEDKLVVANVPFGVSFIRQWIIDNLIKEGEWFLTADDNIQHFTAVEKSRYDQEELTLETEPDLDEASELAEIFMQKIDNDRFWEVVNDTVTKAEKTGAEYCGFAVVDNYYFRNKKWREVGYVISKLALIKKSDIGYDPQIIATDDYGFTAEQLLQRGKVLINNFLFPVAKHYEAGGIGTYEERTPMKIADCKYLMKKYPQLFRYKKKKGCHPLAEIQVRFTDLTQVEKWRNWLTKNKNLSQFF